MDKLTFKAGKIIPLTDQKAELTWHGKEVNSITYRFGLQMVVGSYKKELGTIYFLKKESHWVVKVICADCGTISKEKIYIKGYIDFISYFGKLERHLSEDCPYIDRKSSKLKKGDMVKYIGEDTEWNDWLGEVVISNYHIIDYSAVKLHGIDSNYAIGGAYHVFLTKDLMKVSETTFRVKDRVVVLSGMSKNKFGEVTKLDRKDPGAIWVKLDSSKEEYLYRDNNLEFEHKYVFNIGDRVYICGGIYEGFVGKILSVEDQSFPKVKINAEDVKIEQIHRSNLLVEEPVLNFEVGQNANPEQWSTLDDFKVEDEVRICSAIYRGLTGKIASRSDRDPNYYNVKLNVTEVKHREFHKDNLVRIKPLT